MITSWKTSLCGMAGVLCLGLAETPGLPPHWQHVLRVASGAVTSLGVLLSRDYNKTSSDHGLPPGTNESENTK